MLLVYFQFSDITFQEHLLYNKLRMHTVTASTNCNMTTIVMTMTTKNNKDDD